MQHHHKDASREIRPCQLKESIKEVPWTVFQAESVACLADICQGREGGRTQTRQRRTMVTRQVPMCDAVAHGSGSMWAGLAELG